MSTSLVPPATPPDIVQFFKVLADETRLAIVRLLALTDLCAGEIGAAVQAPPNVVSYHLRQLRTLGVLQDRRSNADARDVYYRVDTERLIALYAAAGDSLGPGIRSQQAASGGDLQQPLRVLFLCTHNSARSQLAEGMLRYLGGEQVEVVSAGNAPTQVHPEAIALLQEWGIDISQHTSKAWDQFLDQSFDYIITVCDRARGNCPVFPHDPQQIHWSMPDPAAIGDPGARWEAFCQIRRELLTRIRYLLSLPHPVTKQRFEIRSIRATEEA